MNHNQLLGKTFECKCGKKHTIPTEYFIYDNNIISDLPEIIKQYTEKANYLILADKRTYDAAGIRVEKSLKDSNAKVNTFIIPDRNGEDPVTDPETKDYLMSAVPDAELFIAVGSGVVNDLTKWVAYERNVPYVVVGTAASMNGYAAANIAAAEKGVKVVFHAKACKGVFAVPEIIENAPFEMTASGLGDIIAKPVSSADWKLNQFLFDEYYCQFSVDLLSDLEKIYLNNPEKIKNRDPEAIKALFEALFYSSVAMTITGTSAPASGGEHLLSHTIDMVSMRDGQKHDFHGRQVGIGTILSAVLYEQIMQVESPELKIMPKSIDDEFWGTLSSVVKPEYEKKQKKSEFVIKKLTEENNWDLLRNSLQERLLSPEKIKNCLQNAGAAHQMKDIRINNQPIDYGLFLSCWKNANQMRERFTVLDLAIMLEIFPGNAEAIIKEWLMDS